MIPIDLGPAWGALGLIQDRARELRARELETPLIGGRTTFVAVDAEGNRHLLIPVAGNAIGSPTDRGGGIRVSSRDLVDAGETRRFLDIACLKPHLNGLFDVVASDILTGCADSSLELVPAACRGALERWRELLEEVATGQIQSSVLTGAWGELWFVRELLRRGAPWADLWEGPTGAIHDVAGARNHRLEVKATTARGPLLVEIHGIGQLEAPLDGALLLGVLRLARDDDRGESIEDLVRTSVFAGANHAELMTLLARVGVTSGSLEFGATRYSVADRRLYEVGPDFPRIVASSLVGGALPAAITSLRYELDLTTNSPVAMTEDAAEAALRLLAGSPI